MSSEERELADSVVVPVRSLVARELVPRVSAVRERSRRAGVGAALGGRA